MTVVDPLSNPAHAFSNEAAGASSIAGQVASLGYQLQQLQRRINLTSRPNNGPIETAVWGSAVPQIQTSPPWRVRIGGSVYEFSIDLRVAALLGTTSVDLYLNGSRIATATIASGRTQSTPVTISSQLAAAGDQLWVDTTLIGRGALGISANAHMG